MNKINISRFFLVSLSLIGALLFSLLLLVSFMSPAYVEQLAKELIRIRVEKTVNQKIDAIDAGFLASQAKLKIKIADKTIASAKQALKDQLPEKISEVIAEMSNLDCECRNEIEQFIRGGLETSIGKSGAMQQRLISLIRSQYMQTAEKLTREFRIFTGSNALIFLLLGVAALSRRQHFALLLPLSLLLVLSTLITAYFYLFEQNWLYTLVFNDYVGYAYIAYIAIIFAFLCDCCFNQARIIGLLLDFLMGLFSIC